MDLHAPPVDHCHVCTIHTFGYIHLQAHTVGYLYLQYNTYTHIHLHPSGLLWYGAPIAYSKPYATKRLAHMYLHHTTKHHMTEMSDVKDRANNG
jgi:hypothetical protein